MNYEIVHAGFDGLDLSYRTLLPSEALERFKSAKAEAIASNSSVALCVSDQEFTISGSGAYGGYQFTVDTGPLGAIWFFKDGVRSDPWGCRVSIKSLPLALFGAAEMKQRCDEFLRRLGCQLNTTACRVSRVDHAFDIIIPDFELNPDLIVCHSKSTKTDYREMETNRAGETITGVRVGRMPGIQLGIYDKRRDAIAKKKSYWWDIWSQNTGYKIGTDTVIWRFEVRAGRKAIDSYFNNTTWEMIGNALGNLLANVCNRIRMVSPGSDTNRSRWPDNPIWSDIRNRLRTMPMDGSCALDQAEILNKLAKERREQLFNQLLGLEMSVAASMGHTEKTYDSFLAYLAMLRSQRIKSCREEFLAKLEAKRALWLARFS